MTSNNLQKTNMLPENNYCTAFCSVFTFPLFFVNEKRKMRKTTITSGYGKKYGGMEKQLIFSYHFSNDFGFLQEKVCFLFITEQFYTDIEGPVMEFGITKFWNDQN